MVAWLADNFSWDGRTSRDQYRRWLPLIVAAELAIIWGIAEFGRNGRLHFEDFGGWGAALLLVALMYVAGWTLLTARRLRTAGLTRSWLLLTIFFGFPIGDSFVSISMLATVALIAVAALVPDSDRPVAA